MIRIDDSLLEELGLIALPKEERDALLRQIYETLEMRVGMKLAERMSEAQLTEFERFIDGDALYVEEYLNTNKSGWQQSSEYAKALQSANEAAQRAGQAVNELAVKSEFAALQWLEGNFPDYKQVVASELEKLKGEIKKDAAHITQAVQQNVPPTGADSAFQAQPPQAPSPDPYDQNQHPPMAA